MAVHRRRSRGTGALVVGAGGPALPGVSQRLMLARPLHPTLVLRSETKQERFTSPGGPPIRSRGRIAPAKVFQWIDIHLHYDRAPAPAAAVRGTHSAPVSDGKVRGGTSSRIRTRHSCDYGPPPTSGAISQTRQATLPRASAHRPKRASALRHGRTSRGGNGPASVRPNAARRVSDRPDETSGLDEATSGHQVYDHPPVSGVPRCS